MRTWRQHVVEGLERQTRVLTPTGWVTAGDVSVGDQVVDTAGRPCRVTAVRSATGAVAQVRLADGCAVTVGTEQSWHVEVGTGDKRSAVWLTTAQLSELLARKAPVRLVHGSAVATASKEARPLAPYLLGALLGDGALSSPDSVVL